MCQIQVQVLDRYMNLEHAVQPLECIRDTFMKFFMKSSLYEFQRLCSQRKMNVRSTLDFCQIYTFSLLAAFLKTNMGNCSCIRFILPLHM